MKLSAYIEEISVPVLSNEEYNEMVDELEAIGEAHKAHKRLVALEALNADTNTAQYQLAMETILTPVGLESVHISAEGLGAKIKGVASRVWAAILRLVASMKSRLGKMYQATKAFILRTKLSEGFLRDYKTIIEKAAPDSAKEEIKRLEETLEKTRYKPHHGAYTDKTVAKRLAYGNTKANLAFKMLKIQADGTNDSEDNTKEETLVPTSLKADLEKLSETIKSAEGWFDELEKVAKGAGAGDAPKDDKKDDKKEEKAAEPEEKASSEGWAMEDDDDADKEGKENASKRVQAAISTITADIATLKSASTKVSASITAFAAAEKKYGDNKDSKDDDKKDDKKEDKKEEKK